MQKFHNTVSTFALCSSLKSPLMSIKINYPCKRTKVSQPANFIAKFNQYSNANVDVSNSSTYNRCSLRRCSIKDSIIFSKSMLNAIHTNLNHSSNDESYTIVKCLKKECKNYA